jgi:hypothetical protein
MAGDVNLFFHEEEEPGSAEINVMIADPLSRRYGRVGFPVVVIVGML